MFTLKWIGLATKSTKRVLVPFWWRFFEDTGLRTFWSEYDSLQLPEATSQRWRGESSNMLKLSQKLGLWKTYPALDCGRSFESYWRLQVLVQWAVQGPEKRYKLLASSLIGLKLQSAADCIRMQLNEWTWYCTVALDAPKSLKMTECTPESPFTLSQTWFAMVENSILNALTNMLTFKS